MKVNGEHEFDVSQTALWEMLMDPVVLAKITPGVGKLEFVDTDQYKAITEIRIGPVKGKFTGNLSVENKQEPDSFQIVTEQLSKIGNAHATVDMFLEAIDEGRSRLRFSGKADLSGLLARTGQRVLSGVANTVTKQVFANLEEHLVEQAKTNEQGNDRNLA